MIHGSNQNPTKENQRNKKRNKRKEDIIILTSLFLPIPQDCCLQFELKKRKYIVSNTTKKQQKKKQ